MPPPPKFDRDLGFFGTVYKGFPKRPETLEVVRKKAEQYNLTMSVVEHSKLRCAVLVAITDATGIAIAVSIPLLLLCYCRYSYHNCCYCDKFYLYSLLCLNLLMSSRRSDLEERYGDDQIQSGTTRTRTHFLSTDRVSGNYAMIWHCGVLVS